MLDDLWSEGGGWDSICARANIWLARQSEYAESPQRTASQLTRDGRLTRLSNLKGSPKHPVLTQASERAPAYAKTFEAPATEDAFVPQSEQPVGVKNWKNAARGIRRKDPQKDAQDVSQQELQGTCPTTRRADLEWNECSRAMKEAD